MTAEENPETILRQNGVILDGHFVLKAGHHSGKYINKDEVYTDAKAVASLCIDLALPFRDDKHAPEELVETVIGPAIGGVVLSHCAAHFLALDGRRIRSVFADKGEDGDGRFVIKRGYDRYITDRRVLVVEDIITTGSSVRGTIEAVRGFGGTVIGVSALCNRGRVTAGSLGVPKLVQLVTMDLETWAADRCPLCDAGMHINVELGHGAAYVAKHGQPTRK
ncbi:phosphoribosyltransferase [Candidatus Uhrbacteria bacterium]|nr:phosphoribosyltransferase [Candidatus Uhrbacteria bacterium]